MSTQEIADRLVALCRSGQNDQAYQELFAEDAVAVEPAFTGAPDTAGRPALLAKSKQFAETVKEMHGSHVSDPVVADNYFSCAMGIDMTNNKGERMKMNEICLYEVRDGKIVKEQFFF